MQYRDRDTDIIFLKDSRASRAPHTYLAPTETEMMLSRLSLHHCSTSCANVALNMALLTTWDVHARKMVANWSRNPVFPSSNNLSDSSTTNHSTLRQNSMVELEIYRRESDKILQRQKDLRRRSKMERCILYTHEYRGFISECFSSHRSSRELGDNPE